MTDFERGYQQGYADAMKAQEPVAWGVFDGPNLHDMFFAEEEAQDMARLKGDGSIVKPLYAAPRPWVGLTDEEIQDVMEQAVSKSSELDDFTGDTARLSFKIAEAKLREKNGG